MLFSDKAYIGKKLKEYRKKASLTQEETASLVNLDEKHYGKLERGIFSPGLETFFKLVKVLNIPLSEFAFDVEENENMIRKEILKEVFLANDRELAAYLNIIKTIRGLF